MGVKSSSFLKEVDFKRGINVKQTKQIFDRFDTDGNGELDRAEATAFLVAWCKEMNQVYSKELEKLFWDTFDHNKAFSSLPSFISLWSFKWLDRMARFPKRSYFKEVHVSLYFLFCFLLGDFKPTNRHVT